MFKNQLRNVFRPKTFPMQIAISFGAFQGTRVFTIDLNGNRPTLTCFFLSLWKRKRVQNKILISDLPLRDSSYCYVLVCRR